MAIAGVLDLRGLRCPLPVLKTAKRLAHLRQGERLAVLADDPLAAIDLPHFCAAEGQTLLGREPGPDGAVRFLIERGARAPLARG